MTNVLFSEECLVERRCAVHGISALRQIAGLHIFRNVETTIPTKPHVVYAGTNTGDVIGPVSFTPWADTWKLPLETKINIYGENRRAVGGRSDGTAPGDDVEEDDDSVLDDDEEGGSETARPAYSVPIVGAGRGKPGRDKVAVEPVAWHTMPVEFYKEVVSSYHGKLVIDLSPGVGNFALHCVEQGVGYLGICFAGEEHKTMLMEHLIDTYLKKMETEGNPVYHAPYAKFVAGAGRTGQTAPTDSAAKGVKPKKNHQRR